MSLKDDIKAFEDFLESDTNSEKQHEAQQKFIINNLKDYTDKEILELLGYKKMLIKKWTIVVQESIRRALKVLDELTF